MDDHHSSGFMGGLLVGAALGTIAGLLIAPRPGRETRQILKKSADALPDLVEDLASTLQIQSDRLSAAALVNWDHTLERLRLAIAAGQDATRQEYSHLSQMTTARSPQHPGQP
jgi:gas vesicle protein